MHFPRDGVREKEASGRWKIERAVGPGGGQTLTGRASGLGAAGAAPALEGC